MYPSEYNTYSCPACSEDVEIPIPHGKYGSCPGCKVKLEIHPDAEFDEDGWHDRTHLSIVDPEREHMKRMLKHLTKERAYDGEDAEEWQRRSEEQGTE